MKKTTKYIIGIFIIPSLILVFLVIYINYDAYLSPKAMKAKDHIEHSYYIKIGMTENEVIKIMGKPDYLLPDKQLIYCYDLNDDSIGSGQIHFDSTKKVEEIYFPNNTIQKK